VIERARDPSQFESLAAKANTEYFMRRLILAGGLALFASQALAQGMDMFPMADADKDGKVTLAEYTTFHEMGWNFLANGADKVKVSDLQEPAKSAFAKIAADANGEITKAAYVAAAPVQFKAADKNGDGTLDQAEFAATMPPPPQ
jgi:hypothetical protein